MKWAIARIPRVVSKTIRNRVRALTELLGWSTINPTQDTALILSAIAEICQKLMDGTRREIAAEIRIRARLLRNSDDRDDLVSACELEDLATDLLVGLDDDDD